MADIIIGASLVISVGIIVIGIVSAAGPYHSQQCGRLQEMRNASLVSIMHDYAREGIWFVLSDRHIFNCTNIRI